MNTSLNILYTATYPCYLALLFKVYRSLRVCGAGDMTSLLQSLVEACDIFLHFFQWRQEGLRLPKQRQASLSHLIQQLTKENNEQHSIITPPTQIGHLYVYGDV